MALKKKKMWFCISLAMLAILGLVGTTIYFFFPQWLVALNYTSYEWQAGVNDKSITVQEYQTSYYQGEAGEPLVLIHGFGDSKISFIQSSQLLSSHYQVILPEVPGFGETERNPNRDYSIRSQVEFFHQLFKSIGLTSFHLGGNSMGGHIATAYTLAYPKQVKSLILLNASGLQVKKELPYQPQGKPVKTVEDFRKYTQELFYQVPSIPKPIEAYFVAQSAKNFSWFNNIRSHIREGDDYLLNQRIDQIKCPTLIIWGDHDTVVLPAVGELYHKNITGSEWILLKNCGHLPQYERPQQTAELIHKFLLSHSTNLPSNE